MIQPPVPEIHIRPKRETEASAFLVIRLSNQSDHQDDRYTLSLSSDGSPWDASWYKLETKHVVTSPSPHRVTVSAGSKKDTEAEVRVTFDVPRNPKARAGVYPFQVTIQAYHGKVRDIHVDTAGRYTIIFGKGNGNQTPAPFTLDARAVVRPYYDWDLTLKPESQQVIRRRCTADFAAIVTNKGNDWLYCRLEARAASTGESKDNALQFTCSTQYVAIPPADPPAEAPPELDMLPPNQRIPLRVEVRSKKWPGGDTVPIELIATRIHAPSVPPPSDGSDEAKHEPDKQHTESKALLYSPLTLKGSGGRILKWIAGGILLAYILLVLYARTWPGKIEIQTVNNERDKGGVITLPNLPGSQLQMKLTGPGLDVSHFELKWLPENGKPGAEPARKVYNSPDFLFEVDGDLGGVSGTLTAQRVFRGVPAWLLPSSEPVKFVISSPTGESVRVTGGRVLVPPTSPTAPHQSGPPTSPTAPHQSGPPTSPTAPHQSGPPTSPTAPHQSGPPVERPTPLAPHIDGNGSWKREEPLIITGTGLENVTGVELRGPAGAPYQETLLIASRQPGQITTVPVPKEAPLQKPLEVRVMPQGVLAGSIEVQRRTYPVTNSLLGRQQLEVRNEVERLGIGWLPGPPRRAYLHSGLIVELNPPPPSELMEDRDTLKVRASGGPAVGDTLEDRRRGPHLEDTPDVYSQKDCREGMRKVLQNVGQMPSAPIGSRELEKRLEQGAKQEIRFTETNEALRQALAQYFRRDDETIKGWAPGDILVAGNLARLSKHGFGTTFAAIVELRSRGLRWVEIAQASNIEVDPKRIRDFSKLEPQK